MTAATPGPVDSTDAIRLALRSWPEVESYLQGCKGVIIPLGSTEQHGPTGAIGTDALTAEAVALEVGRRTGVLVTPAQAFGMAEHHLGFAGTMSLQPATLLAVLHDLVLSLGRHGFERVFVINGHGGNIATRPKPPLPRPTAPPPPAALPLPRSCVVVSPTGSWPAP